MRWFSIPELAARYGVVPATVTGWIEDGELEAVNIARKSSQRKRYRVSEKATEKFERQRASDSEQSAPVATTATAIPRPKKNYFAAARAAESSKNRQAAGT